MDRKAGNRLGVELGGKPGCEFIEGTRRSPGRVGRLERSGSDVRMNSASGDVQPAGDFPARDAVSDGVVFSAIELRGSYETYTRRLLEK